MADKLLPCPFCGGEAKFGIDFAPTRDLAYCFECEDCGALVYMDDLNDKDKSIKAWNNRPSPWHTGTPTEGGLYFVYDKYCGYGKRELKKDISEEQLKDAFHNVLAWMPIEPYKEKEE